MARFDFVREGKRERKGNAAIREIRYREKRRGKGLQLSDRDILSLFSSLVSSRRNGKERYVTRRHTTSLLHVSSYKACRSISPRIVSTFSIAFGRIYQNIEAFSKGVEERGWQFSLPRFDTKTRVKKIDGKIQHFLLANRVETFQLRS